MNKIKLSIPLLYFCLSLGSVAFGQSGALDVAGWGCARWGMTKAEFLNACGHKVLRLDKPITASASPHYVEYSTPEASSTGYSDYEALYWFNNRTAKLEIVQLVPDEKSVQGMIGYDINEAVNRDAQIMLRDLVKNFGQPDVDVEKDDPNLGRHRYLLWKKPSRDIEMYYSSGRKWLKHRRPVVIAFTPTYDVTKGQ